MAEQGHTKWEQKMGLFTYKICPLIGLNLAVEKGGDMIQCAILSWVPATSNHRLLPGLCLNTCMDLQMNSVFVCMA